MILNDKYYSRALVTLVALVLVYLLYVLTPVIVPFLVAMVLAYLFNPVARWLAHFGIPRWLSIVLAFTVIGFVIAIAMVFLVPRLWHQFQLATDNMPVFLNWLNVDARTWLNAHLKINLPPFDTKAISNILLDYVQQNYSAQDAGSLITKIATSGMSAMNIVGLVVLVPVLAFFFMMSWGRVTRSIRSSIPVRMQPKVYALMDECNEVTMSFVKGQMLVMVILGLIYAIGLQFLAGLDTGLIIGFVAGLASLVPYLGIVVGILAAVVATIVQFGFDWHMLLLVAVVFAIGQVVEGYILQPFLLGDRIGLSPIMVIFAVLVGGKLLGLVGMLLALPLGAVLMVLFRHAYKAYKSSAFYLQPKDNDLKQTQLNSDPKVDAELKIIDTEPHDLDNALVVGLAGNSTAGNATSNATSNKPAWLQALNQDVDQQK